MKMKELFNPLLAAAVALVASGAAMADDPAYVTGADYEVSNGWLIVKSGDGTLVAQFDKYEASGSAQVSRLVVAEGTTLKLGIDDPFLKKPIMYINGTLDLNGHDLGALRLFNDPDQENNLSYDIADRRSVLGRIVNTSSTAVTLGLTSSGESHFYGTIEELPGAISLEPVVTGASGGRRVCRGLAQLEMGRNRHRYDRDPARQRVRHHDHDSMRKSCKA